MSVAPRLKIRPYAAESFDDLDIRDLAEIEAYLEAEMWMQRDHAGKGGNRRSSALPDGYVSLEEAFGEDE